MRQSKGTLWIDLTMLLNWKGNLTGIQRVEYNLASRFALLPGIAFCVFDKQRRVMVPYDFANIVWKVESLQRSDSTQIAPLASASLRAALRTRAIIITPQFVKRRAKRTIAGLRNLRVRQARSTGEVIFGSRDSLMILSGDWSDSVFATTISELRQTKSLRVVQIVYDMLPAVHPQYFVPGMPEQFSNYMAKIFANCDGILAISQATKNDIVSFQKQNMLPKVAVKVFRLGDDFVLRKPVKPRLPITPGGYILCVGTVEARKNHMILYSLIKEAASQGRELPSIVVVGKKGWLVDNLLYLTEHDQQLGDKMIFPDNTTDEELAWLFEHCWLTVYPSFCEGWGLPIAESLFYNKYCLASSTSSMTEIAGVLIEYFSPYNVQQLLEKIIYYLDNPQELTKKEVALQAGYASTSWSETFTEVNHFIQDIHSRS